MSNFSKRLIYIFNFVNKRNLTLLNTVRPSLCRINHTSFIRLNSSLSSTGSPHLLNSNEYRMIFTRQKSKHRKSRRQSKDDEDDEDDDYDDIDVSADELGKGVEMKKISVESLRIDLLLKLGLGFNRQKIEKFFYQNKLRVNGKIPLKKSTNAGIGDEIDVVKGFANENPGFLNVGRIEIVNVKLSKESGSAEVTIKSSKNLLIDNYPDGHSWNAPS